MNLYLIGGAVVGAILYTIAVFFYGEHVESLAWQVKIAEMNQQMADTKVKHDAAIADLNLQLESSHANHQRELDTKGNELTGLADDLDRLRAKSKACGDKRVQAAAVPAGSPSPAGKPAGAVPELDGSFKELNALIAQCVSVAEYARTCHDWAVAPAVSKP